MTAQQTFAFFESVDSVGKTTRAPQAGRSTKLAGRTAIAKKAAATARTKTASAEKPSGSAAKSIGPVNETAQSLSDKPSRATNAADDTASLLKRLRHQVGCVSTVPQNRRPTCSTGCDAIDDVLPSGGLRMDGLTEWVASSSHSSAGVLSLIAAANRLRHASSTSPLVVVDTDHQFYPPAAIALGIPADRIVLVRIQRHADVVWAIDQALRCDAVGAVWANVGAWLDDRDARRFQLAAEIGKTSGLFVRPAAVRGRPSFADVRFCVDQVSPMSLGVTQWVAPSSLLSQVTIDRCRGGTTGQQVLVQVNEQAQMMPLSVPLRTSQPAAHHDTATPTAAAAVHLANQLAHPAAPQSDVARHQERRA